MKKNLGNEVVKKVVFVTNTSWYAYNFYKELINHLVTNQVIVHVVSPDDKYFPALHQLGVITKEISFDRRGLNPISEFSFIFKLFLHLKLVEPSFVFNFTIKPNIWSGLVCRLLQIPYVNTISGLGSSFISGGLIKEITSFLYKIGCGGAVNNLVMNEADYNQLKAVLPKQVDGIIKIPGTGIDLDFFKCDGSKIINEKKFLFIGRILKDKGVIELLDAFNSIDDDDITLDIVGDFDEGNPSSISYNEFTNKIQNNKRITHHGYQEDIKSFVRRTSFVILPSYREGLPRVLMESLSMGKPILASDVPGCQDLVNSDTGFSFDVMSSISLANSIIDASKLSESNYRSLSISARNYAVQELDQQKVISHYSSYVNLCNK